MIFQYGWEPVLAQWILNRFWSYTEKVVLLLLLFNLWIWYGYNCSYFSWVPVAPVSTGLVASFSSQLLTPTLIVVGENDRSLGNRSKEDLKGLPNATLPQVCCVIFSLNSWREKLLFKFESFMIVVNVNM